MIDLEKMAEQHKQLFPNATAESQFYKMEEEIEEFNETIDGSNEELKEIADVIIVCAGLYRWFPKTAYQICREMYWLHEGKLSGKIISEVNRKWQINLKKNGNGTAKLITTKGKTAMNEKQLNGILYALQKLQKALTVKNPKIYLLISEAMDSLSAVLKNNS